jgi:hypothetical protein
VLALAPISLLLAQDVAMLYPGLYLALLLAALEVSRRRALEVALGGAVTLLLVVTLYLFIWRNLELGPSGGETAFWGRKYGTFYVEGGDASRLEWFAERLFDMASFPGMRNWLWASNRVSEEGLDLLRTQDSWLWVALVAAGALAIAWRRGLALALLLVLPLATLCLLNRAGFWPLGAFRTNLFVLLYTAARACLALDQGLLRLPSRLAVVPALVFVVAPFVAFETSWHANKRVFSESSAFPSALQGLLQRQGPDFRGPPETVLLDSRTCPGWRFYTQHHPGVRKWLPEDFEQRLSPSCRRKLSPRFVRSQVKEAEGRVWVMANARSSIRRYDDEVPRGLKVTERIELRFGGELTDLVLGFELR